RPLGKGLRPHPWPRCSYRAAARCARRHAHRVLRPLPRRGPAGAAHDDGTGSSPALWPQALPNPGRRAYRSGSTRGEITLRGRRTLVPGWRARSVEGHELALPSFMYAAGRDPLDARTLEAIAIGVTTRKYRRALDPLPA